MTPYESYITHVNVIRKAACSFGATLNKEGGPKKGDHEVRLLFKGDPRDLLMTTEAEGLPRGPA